MDKKTLRKKYTALRENLSNAEIDEQSLAIANNALQLPIWDKTNYHIFLPIEEKKEVNTAYLLHILQGRDKSVIVPKADFSTGEMIHYLLQENTVLKLSEYNIPEPVDGIKIAPEQLDVVFVPLLVFDENGYRVGYGKGFYDRFLAKCSKNCVMVGLSLFEAIAQIPYENLDIPVKYCITPQKTYSF